MPGTVTKFLIADSAPVATGSTVDGHSFELKKSLDVEQRIYGDLIFIHGIMDAYSNLHLKVLLLWISSLELLKNWYLSDKNSEQCKRSNKIN
jgi:hypothetical protein